MFFFNSFQVLVSIISVLTLQQTSVVSNPEVANEETEKLSNFPGITQLGFELRSKPLLLILPHVPMGPEAHW